MLMTVFKLAAVKQNYF